MMQLPQCTYKVSFVITPAVRYSRAKRSCRCSKAGVRYHVQQIYMKRVGGQHVGGGVGCGCSVGDVPNAENWTAYRLWSVGLQPKLQPVSVLESVSRRHRCITCLERSNKNRRTSKNLKCLHTLQSLYSDSDSWCFNNIIQECHSFP